MSSRRRFSLATAVLLVACAPTATAPTTLSPSPQPPTLTATPSPVPSPTPTPTSDPSAAAHFRTLAAGWRPATTTAMVLELNPSVHTSAGATLVAVPLDGSAATKLVALQDSIAVRPDGGAVAAAITGGIAVWETSGTTRWALPADDRTVTTNPVWTPDGSSLYFGRLRPTVSGPAEDLGVFRVRPDGSGLERIVDPQPPGQAPPFISIPRRVTPENVLVWGRAYEGATLEVLDLASRRQRSYQAGVGDLAAWRATQPRALIQHCSNTGCRGLVEWDDESGATRRILADDIQVWGADREPGGTRIVVARRTSEWGLDVIDGTAATRLAGTTNAQWPRWLAEGIVHLWGADERGIGVSPLVELRIVSPTAGTPRVLYRSSSPEHSLFLIDVLRR